MATDAATISSPCGREGFWPARVCRRVVAVQAGRWVISLAARRAQSRAADQSRLGPCKTVALEQQGPCA